MDRSEHLIVLIHGINTRALWLDVVRPTLESSGFRVSPTSYGKYSIIRFLLPFSFFRKKAEQRVLKNINSAIAIHHPKEISVIAHSFGSYVSASLISNNPEIRWNRVIFCGSVIAESFQIDQYIGRFNPPIINEVGTSDFWPAVAESVGWGYGSAGSTGLHHPAVLTRWHRGFGHSHFLTREFTEKFWVPFLEDGRVVTADSPMELPWYIRCITAFPLRYLAPAAFIAACAVAILSISAALSDITLSGLVTDEATSPVRGAAVEVSGVGITTTKNDGVFSIDVPYAKRLDSYSLTISANSFKTTNIKVSGGSSDPIAITLDRLFLTLDDVIDIGKTVSISQNVGDPVVIIQLKIRSKPEDRLYFQIEELNITRNGVSLANLQPVMVQKNLIPFNNQYLQGIALHDETVGNDYQFLFSDDQFKKWATVGKIANLYGRNWLDGCLGPDGIPDGIVDILRDYFDAAFSWTAGDYEIIVNYKMYDTRFRFSWKFKLDEKSSLRLKGMREKIKVCGGVMLIPQQIGNLSYYDDAAQNFVFLTPERAE